ncbi:FeoC-like transcriptional regulator [Martelella mangrovi]|uniref:Transcriptional regulator HTH-type FeoC domain-containing protein n=1 Tax=Martelella mangrovi TaxID=1397477 RepID=A0ABV2IB42_9HYPH|nr:FeoC-like transcriptional regulator [uncultured Martelella sp.]
MLLSDIRHHLTENRIASVQELSNRFDTDIEAVEDIMAVLERKGSVRLLSDAPPACASDGCSCGCGCSSSAQKSAEIYEWIGRSKRDRQTG